MRRRRRSRRRSPPGWLVCRRPPYARGLSREEGAKLAPQLSDAVTRAVNATLQSEGKGLPKLRSTVLAALARHKKVPFYFGKLGQGTADYEATLAALLGEQTVAARLTASERMAAATALVTFAGRRAGDDALTSVRAALAAQRLTAATNAEREIVEGLVGVVK